MTDTKTPPRVLVVEDEPDIAAVIAYQLTREGYRVETALNGAAALDALHRDLPDPATEAVPVLIVTAKKDQADRIQGLELGADDYLTKPFSPRELVLRADAILRRTQGERRGAIRGGPILRAGPLRVDVGAHYVTLDDEEVQLTPTEFRLLQTLMERRGRTQSRRQLLTEAWDVDSVAARQLHTRTVDMHVRRLRGKLGPAGEWIETVRGFGYRLQRPTG